MDSERVHVRNVEGRYPVRAVLRGENIEARVREEAHIIRLRLDDHEHPEFWMEVTLEIEE